MKFGQYHSGKEGEKGNGDVFIWNNNSDFYGSDSAANSSFYNYAAEFIKEGRDYHLSIKPGYKSCIYPHPLRKVGDLP